MCSFRQLQHIRRTKILKKTKNDEISNTHIQFILFQRNTFIYCIYVMFHSSKTILLQAHTQYNIIHTENILHVCYYYIWKKMMVLTGDGGMKPSFCQ